MSYAEGDNLLDGPKLAEWIEARCEDPSPNLERRLWAWSHGETAGLATVDHYLVTELGLHPNDLPDDLWIPAHRFCLRCGEDIGLRKENARLCHGCRKSGAARRYADALVPA